MVVFDGSIDEDTLGKEVKNIEDLLTTGASFESTVQWGRRQLAYEIKGKRSGYYCLFLYQGENTIVEQIDKLIKFNENVLRSLSVVREPNKRTAKDIVAVEESEESIDDSDE
jgi:small subunit ribosomal protein S6